MVLKGHVSEGVIVLDDPRTLPEGATVIITLPEVDEDQLPYRRYRGTNYSYPEPFEPALPEQEWEANR